MKFPVTTLPPGARAWFVRRNERGAIEWAVVCPSEDGSASVRIGDRTTYMSAPAGGRDALLFLDEQGFSQLESAYDEGIIAIDAEPPDWPCP